MPDLQFRIEGVEVARYTATPLLNFKLRVIDRSAVQIANINLQCQIQIEAAQRKYAPDEQFKLSDLFGESQRWNQTLRTMLWTHANALIPAFKGDCQVDLRVPCSFDFNVVATKYFHALNDGDIPLSFQFSGSVFYRTENAGLQVGQIPWDGDVRFKLPVALWREMIEHYYPNSAWLCLDRDVFERLHAYKLKLGLTSWEGALEHALAVALEHAPAPSQGHIPAHATERFEENVP